MNQNTGWILAGILLIVIILSASFYFGYRKGQLDLKNQINNEGEIPLRFINEKNETFFINTDLDKYCNALLQQVLQP